jgi:hypothetical protein
MTLTSVQVPYRPAHGIKVRGESPTCTERVGLFQRAYLNLQNKINKDKEGTVTVRGVEVKTT